MAKEGSVWNGFGVFVDEEVLQKNPQFSNLLHMLASPRFGSNLTSYGVDQSVANSLEKVIERTFHQSSSTPIEKKILKS